MKGNKKWKEKLNELHRFLSNRIISTVARRIIIISFGTSPNFRMMVVKCGFVINGRQLPWNLLS